jgi:hypothetical protein
MGMGCTQKDTIGSYRIAGFETINLCDTRKWGAHIVKQCIAGKLTGTKRHNKFLPIVIDVVKRELVKGGPVILRGHSYGGLLASMAARGLLEEGVNVTNLKVITTGSIYIPNASKLQGVDCVHLMAVGDVALRCNGLKKESKRVAKDERVGLSPISIDGGYVYWLDFGKDKYIHMNEGYPNVAGKMAEAWWKSRS